MILWQGKYELVSKFKRIHRKRWKSATAIYRGARLVWMAVRSCFGAGFWLNDRPWLNNEGWKN